MVEDGFGASSANEHPITSLTEIMEEQCPIYMAMGMSYDEYWNGELERVKFYRKAFKFKKKQDNEKLWLQGAYIYKALEAIYPLFNAWADGVEVQPYVEYPFPLDAEEQKAQNTEKAKAEMERMRTYMETKLNTVKAKQKGE